MKTFLAVLEELGWPRVYLVPPKQYERVDGLNLYKKETNGDFYVGFSSDVAPVFTLRHNLRGKKLRNTIYHEILHLLYPWQHEWWIECAGEKLANGGGRGWYSRKYNHTPEELPSREKMLENIRKQVIKFNRRRYQR